MTEKFLTPGLAGSYLFAKSRIGDPSEAMHKMHGALNTSLAFRHWVSHSNSCGGTGDLFSFDDSGVVATLGNPVWNDDIPGFSPSFRNPAEDLVNAYKLMGPEFVHHLSGCFSFILVDGENSCCMIAVDRLSRYPIYWARTGQCIVAASSAGAILAHPQIESSISPQDLFNYVYFHMVPSPGSIYTGIHKLLAGHVLVAQGEKITVHPYWQPDFRSPEDINFATAATTLKLKLQESVSGYLDDSVSTGTFLSGGLDSSTVAGMLSEIYEGGAQAFSIGFAAEGYDEMAYARITANHFGVRLHEYYVTPEDVVDALPKVAASYDEPFGNSSALPAYFCAKLAKAHGIERLLAGDGGDELFAGNERYAKQGVFEHYHTVPKWLRQGLLEPIARAIPARRGVIAKGKSYINQANTPLPDRLQTYNFLHRHDSRELFTDEFLSAIDPDLPLKYQREAFNRAENASTLNRMLCLDWQYTLADNDLRKVSHMCAMAGVEVVYPMLDDRLVEFSCSIPGSWKLRRNGLRYFYKESLRGWLPDETISKKKQGFGLPFGVWMQTHKPLRELAYDNLCDLKKRHILKPEFIDQVVHMHQDVHAAYYGELVWILTVLELWLAAHSPQPQILPEAISA